MGKNQHVVPHDGQWDVRGQGNARVTSQHLTQTAATNAGRRIARGERSEVVIDRRDGTMRDEDSYRPKPEVMAVIVDHVKDENNDCDET